MTITPAAASVWKVRKKLSRVMGVLIFVALAGYVRLCDRI